MHRLPFALFAMALLPGVPEDRYDCASIEPPPAPEGGGDPLPPEPFAPQVGDRYQLPNGEWATVTARDEDLLENPAPLTRVRAKFVVDTRTPVDENGCGTVTLRPVMNGSPENEEFYRLSPSGGITLSTINPRAYGAFEPGAEFYVDFSRATG